MASKAGAAVGLPGLFDTAARGLLGYLRRVNSRGQVWRPASYRRTSRKGFKMPPLCGFLLSGCRARWLYRRRYGCT